MARVTDVFVNGTMGNVVFYRRMGTSCVRIKRNNIKQTAATKIRSENFGIASRAGRPLRQGLAAVIPFRSNRSMQSRFSGAIAKWLCLSDVNTLPLCDAVPYVTGFQFTSGNTFTERFKVPIAVSQPQDNIIKVNVDAFVPAMHVTAPAGTLMIELVIAVASCTLATGMPAVSQVKRIQAAYNNEEIMAQELQFNITGLHGNLVVTGAWLQYFVLKNNTMSRSENPAFMPAGVISAKFI